MIEAGAYGRPVVATAMAARGPAPRFISSRALSATDAAAIRGHRAIENRLHWVLDIALAEDQSCLRKGHGARNTAIVRHFALNLVRKGQALDQVPTQDRRMGPDLPRRHPRLTTRTTWIRSPDRNRQPTRR